MLCLLVFSDMVELSEALDMEALLEALDMVDLSDIADLSDMVDLSEALDMLVWLEEGWLEQLPRWLVSTDSPSVESTGAKNNDTKLDIQLTDLIL